MRDFAPGLMRMRCYDEEAERGVSFDEWSPHEFDPDHWNPHQFPPVVRWRGADRNQWRDLLLDAKVRASVGMRWIRQSSSHYPDRANLVILANELNYRAVGLAQANVRHAGMADVISLRE